MRECPHCNIGFDEHKIELEITETDFETGERRYMCPECGYVYWE